MRIRIHLLAGLFALVMVSTPGDQVQAAEEALAQLLSGFTYGDPKPVIDELRKRADERSKAIVAAWDKRKLFVRLPDNAIVIAEKDGEGYLITNALTGDIEAMASPEELKPLQTDPKTKEELGGSLPESGQKGQPFDFASGLRALNADDFDAKRKAIDQLTCLRDPRVIAAFRALSEGRLFVRKSDGAIVLGEPSGNRIQLRDPATLARVGLVREEDLDVIFVNNNLRGRLNEAIGRLGLLSPDVGQRRRAADALLDGASPETVEILRKAFAKETVSSVKRSMAQAVAAFDLVDPDRTRRLAAVLELAGSADLRVRSLLQARLREESDQEVRAAISGAFDRIQTKIRWLGYAENLVQGVSLGSVLLLSALGLTITFGVMGVINMAHGEMIMLGAYSAYLTQEIFRAFLPPSWINAYLIAALPVAFLIAAAFGVVMERYVIRFLYGRPLDTMLATWGISLGLQQLVRTIFGASNKEVANPGWMTGAIELAGGFTVTWNRLYILLFSFAMLAWIALILHKTSFGVYMRAVTQNRSMASVMGIPTGSIDALTFGLGSGIAGTAGVALSQIGNVSPNLGQIYIVDSFLVVVFGGVGNILGTLIGALTLGVVNKSLEPLAGAVLGHVVVLVLIILFIQKCPRGLFAAKGRVADA